jgi:uncharacterized protein
MALHMFRSPTVAKVIAVLALHEEEEFGAEELSARVGVARPNVFQALRYLEMDGIVNRRAVGKKHLYRAAVDHPLYPELKGIAIKTFGGQEQVLRALREDPRVLFAAIYGSVARGDENPRSDIDVLVVVADEDAEESDYRVASRLAVASHQIGRSVHSSIHSLREFHSLRRTNDVMRSILSSPLVVLKGSLEHV